MRGLRGWRVGVLVLLLFAMAAACADDDEQAEPAATAADTGGRFGCLDFVATVTTGPDKGRSWTGDLILTPDETGAFTGLLVPPEDVDRETLRIKDRSRAICRAVGQRNGAQVSWFLYCGDGRQERIFGTGQITVTAEGQELRGIINGPADDDFGVYHGRNYPPYIRTISGD